MPIVIEVQYQKRLGLRNFSSHSFGVTVRTEVPDLSHVERQSAQLYALLQSSVDREMQQEGYVPDPMLASNGNGHTNGNGSVHPRNGNHQNGQSSGNHTNGYRLNGRSNGDGGNRDQDWQCSPKQKDLLYAVMEDNRLSQDDLESIAHEMFNASLVDLNKMEFSGFIGELLDRYPKQGHKGNGNGRGQRTYSRGSRR